MTSGVFRSTPGGEKGLARMSRPDLAVVQAEESEEVRRQLIQLNRAYYEGSQFDRNNDLWCHANGVKADERMPEHKRLHAQSTQIAECVDFIANMLTDGFAFVVEDSEEQRREAEEQYEAEKQAVEKATPTFEKRPKVEKPGASDSTIALQDIINKAVTATDVLFNGEDDDIGFDDLLVEAAQAGDVPYETLWDPIEQTAYWEFWPAEQVTFDVPRGRWVKKVTRTQIIIVQTLDEAGKVIEKEIEERVEWDLAYPPPPADLELTSTPVPVSPIGEDEDDDSPGPAGPVVAYEPHLECRRSTFHDGAPEPVAVEWTGLPMIPWGVLRVDKKGLKGFRGDPLITKRARDNADRFNANEQHAFLIGRYNSHGNIAVTGDQAFVKLQIDPIINKDVADVISLPGDSHVVPITLPTDDKMINHTKAVTSDAIYASFGLVRVDPDTINGLGTVSGYALEILNSKSDGTTRRVKRTVTRDALAMVNMMLDVTAYREAAVMEDEGTVQLYEENPEFEVPTGMLPPVPYWAIDPSVRFPDRNIEVRMGSAYIVDSVQIRDNFTTKLISHREALRQLGYSNDDIEKIMDELEDESKSQSLDAAASFMARTGQTVEQAQAEKDAEQDALANGQDPDEAKQKARADQLKPASAKAGSTVASGR